MAIGRLIPRFRVYKRVRPQPGAPPGTLVTREDLPPPTLRRMTISPEAHEETEIQPDDVAQLLRVEGELVWIDVQGLGDAATITSIGKALGLHPLTVEDIVHVHQRPKVEQFEDYLFIVLSAVRLAEDGQVDAEQISLIVKEGLLVTFQERPGDGFAPVRRRIREGTGVIRRSPAGYLAYALIDIVIDNTFPVLERFGELMDQLDDEVLEHPTRQTSNGIHAIKRELRRFRRAIWPLRDVVGTLGRDEFPQISAKVRPAFRDCHDHATQIVEFIETSRERAADLVDRYLAAVSERTNQVMKVLTIISTIFIPLTFLAGIYGMNFDPAASPFNMPELRWRYGYPAFWVALAVILMGMLWFFRRKGWIGAEQEPSERPETARDSKRRG